MNFLFLFDTTGFAAEPFTDMGHTTTIVDIENVGEHRFNGRATRILDWNVLDHEEDLIKIAKDCAFVFGFPPCTDLALSGAKHFVVKSIDDPEFQEQAVHLCRSVERIAEKAGVPWAAENPKSALAKLWRKSDFTFHPYEYGGWLDDAPHPVYPKYIAPQDAYEKETHLWHSSDFRLPEKKPVEPEWHHTGFSRQTRLLGGDSKKTKRIRSASPRGFFTALASLYAPEYAL